MDTKKTIAMFAVLCLIALGLGYLVGQLREGSEKEKGENGEGKEKVKSEAASKEPEFLKQGLVAYYPFNGNTKDESGNGNDGEIEGANLVFDRKGKSNSAYRFDGNDSIVVADDEKLRNPYLTISVWLKCNEGDDSIFISKIDSVRPDDLNKPDVPFAHQYRLRLQTKKPIFDVSLEPLGRSFSSAASMKILRENHWNQVVGTWDGKTQKCYLNGVLVLEKTNAPNGDIRNIIGGDLIFGRGWNPSSGFFKGELDDIRIYNRALSEAQVKALYEFEKAKE